MLKYECKQKNNLCAGVMLIIDILIKEINKYEKKNHGY